MERESQKTGPNRQTTEKSSNHESNHSSGKRKNELPTRESKIEFATRQISNKNDEEPWFITASQREEDEEVELLAKYLNASDTDHKRTRSSISPNRLLIDSPRGRASLSISIEHNRKQVQSSSAQTEERTEDFADLGEAMKLPLCELQVSMAEFFYFLNQYEPLKLAWLICFRLKISIYIFDILPTNGEQVF